LGAAETVVGGDILRVAETVIEDNIMGVKTVLQGDIVNVETVVGDIFECC